MPDPLIAPAVFTIDECATYLQIPKRTLYVKAQHGDIPSIKPGRRVLFPKYDLDVWMTKEARRRTNTTR